MDKLRSIREPLAPPCQFCGSVWGHGPVCDVVQAFPLLRGRAYTFVRVDTPVGPVFYVGVDDTPNVGAMLETANEHLAMEVADLRCINCSRALVLIENAYRHLSLAAGLPGQCKGPEAPPNWQSYLDACSICSAYHPLTEEQQEAKLALAANEEHDAKMWAEHTERQLAEEEGMRQEAEHAQAALAQHMFDGGDRG